MTKTWVFEKNQINIENTEFSKALNISIGIAAILRKRGIDNFETAKEFFRPELEQLHDPFLMKDLDKAVNRLSEAIFNNEKIIIYGDYDVDGTTSVSLVYLFLKEFSDQLEYYIPDRYLEGYGISEKGVRHAHKEGSTLMIALDCGIRAMEQAELAKSLNIDLIICDHHLPGPSLPDAFAILDPKRADCNYPYKELSGCGVGFKLLQGFCQQNTIPIEKLYNQLDLLVVSIASDIVPITGENRVLAYYGLKKLNNAPSVGLKALIEISALKNNMSITNVVFGIGPRINAAGRIAHAMLAVELLVADDPLKAEEIAALINEKNTERKELDKSITEEAIEMMTGLEEQKATVLYKEDWHKGVIGIVASRCIERCYRPTIIFTYSKDKIVGSARSVDGFDVHEAIHACKEHVEQFGGHKYAAGLTLAPDKLEDFKLNFEKAVAARILPEQLIPKLLIDAEISLDELSFNFHGVIEQMAPFGPANLQPVFVTRNLVYKNVPRLLKDAHIKMQVMDKVTGKILDGIAFGFGEIFEDLLDSDSFDLAYHLDVNEYKGNKTLQLMIKDIKLNHST